MTLRRAVSGCRWTFAPGILLTGSLLLAGCGSTTSGAESSADSGTGAPSPSTAVEACVSDAAAVIAAPELSNRETPLPADLVAELDAAAQSGLAEAAAPGAVVGVWTPEGSWISAFGLADPDTGAPMTVDVHHRIGSVTKTITGTVLLQLAQDGLLSLDDVIGDYVPDVPNGDRVTLRQLANMTSGVASYTRSKDFTDVYFADPSKVYTPDELLAVGLAIPPLFEPGAQFDYSNTNTVLLGQVIEQVTGMEIGDVFAQRVFEPLGLSETSWPGDSAELPTPHARGFTTQGQGSAENPADATNWNPAWGWTAGEAISTVDDLLTYGRALGTGRGLLDPQSQEIRLTSFPGPAGYGIAMGCTSGWVGHTGELPGFNTSLFYDTMTDSTVVVAANSDIASGDCTESITLPDNPTGIPCMSPASRIALAVTTALGRPFMTPPIS